MTPSVTAVAGSLAPTRGTGGELTDIELVSAVRKGDDRAFERLYERYHRRIAAYIYGMVNDYGRAEDIAQDVFMSALRRMRETDRPIAFKPWVYEIAKNACIDQFRRSRRSEEVSYDAENSLGAADYGRLVTTGPAPDVAVDQKMTLGHLCGAFGGLSETHHRILVMREFEGLSYREIGEQLGMSRPSVESTLFRARRRLTEEYSELASGERCLRVQATIAGAGSAAGVRGLRDHRRLAAHVSHCQPCRRAAHAAGLDIELTPGRAVRAKIAAFLPFPAFFRRRGGGGGGTDLGGSGSTHLGTVAQWSAQASSLDPAVAGWFKAASAAAAIAAVGVGAGHGSEQLTRGGDRPVVPRAALATPAAKREAVLQPAVRRTPAAVSGAAATGTSTAKLGGRTVAKRPSSTGAKAQASRGTASSAAGPTSAGTPTLAGTRTPLPPSPTAATLLPGLPSGAPSAPSPGPVKKPAVPTISVPVPVLVPPLPVAPVTSVVQDAGAGVSGVAGTAAATTTGAVAGIVAGK
jgi:RNA polymerase sigma factor (sigma-70 family)